MASAIYNGYKSKLGVIDWGDNAGVTIRVMLVTIDYPLDIDNHVNIVDITGEVVGDGYTARGAILPNRTIVSDLANDWAEYNGDDIVWSSSTITARGAVVYLDTGVDTTSTLIAYVDFVVDKTSSAGDFIIQWHTDGVFRIG